jgi:hypothetical protein
MRNDVCSDLFGRSYGQIAPATTFINQLTRTARTGIFTKSTPTSSNFFGGGRDVSRSGALESRQPVIIGAVVQERLSDMATRQ